MGKIGIIVRREFNERVRKKSFIVTTILTPLLMVGVIAAPILIQMLGGDTERRVIVVDRSGLVADKLQSSEQLRFETTDREPERIREEKPEDVFGILVIGADVMDRSDDVQFYTYESSTLEIESSIAGQISKILEDEKLRRYDIDNLAQIMAEVETDISLQTYRIDESGGEKESSSVLSVVSAYVFGFLIYMFVLIYGGMVLQGVVEEKSNKVLEVMVSSVKPYDMMMGKILGIASVALTQFLIWVAFIGLAGWAITHFVIGEAAMQAMSAMPGTEMVPAGMEGMDAGTLAAIRNATDPIYLAKMLGGFLVYFIGGYLLYAAMFAAVGSAVDNMADTQQLQVPLTIPIILALIVMLNVMHEPHSSLAVWFSMIPFTSPIIMMARLPYGVPVGEVIASVVLLYATFFFMVWVAGKIYRVGIFMYGKKPSFKELYKWCRYKY